MIRIDLLPDNRIELIVDTSIYSDNVITKFLYWLTENFIITRENITDSSNQRIILKKTERAITDEEFETLRVQLSQSIVDYKNREIIHEETKDIRNILYVKAFANSDDFIELDFSK